MPTTITPFTTTPSRANPATFSADMDTRLTQENSRIAEMNLQSGENNVINANVNTKEGLATNAASTATTKATLATDYAEKMALPVETGTYSAKEHAIGDLTASGGSAKAWAIDTASPDGTTSKSAKTLAAEAVVSASAAASSASSASSSATTASNGATTATAKALEAATSAANALASELAATSIVTAPLQMAIGNINSPLLDLPLKNSLAMKAGVGSATFTRTSTATYIDRYGVLKTAAIDEPRFEKEGYLNEGTSTNLLTYSEQFDNAIWAKTSSTVSANTAVTTDPYGTNLADKLVETADTNYHYIYQIATITAGTTYANSVFLKAGERSLVRVESWNSTDGSKYVDIDLSTGVANSTQSFLVTPATNGWYRISVISTPTITNIALRVMFKNPANGIFEQYLGDGTSGLYIFGAQLEALPFTTSYIPTVASAVTRSSDNLSVTASDNVGKYNNEMTMMVDFDCAGKKENFQRLLKITNTNDANAVHQLIGTWATANSCEPYFNNTNAGDSTHLIKSFNTKYRLCASILPAQVKYYIDGALVSTLSSITTNTYPLNLIFIGSNNLAIAYHFGHITNVRIYDKALTVQEVALA